MILSCIAAVADNGVIGSRGALPWHAPADLKHFRKTTWGHHLIMGRTTYETVGRPLPGRTTIVLTHRTDFRAPEGVLVAHSLEQALDRCAGEEEVFVVGGAVVYRAALPHANRIYLTRVHASPEGDTLFPELDATAWRVVSEREHEPDERNPVRLTFQVLERTPAGASRDVARRSTI
jgi:dihydrofolate reductase